MINYLDDTKEFLSVDFKTVGLSAEKSNFLSRIRQSDLVICIFDVTQPTKVKKIIETSIIPSLEKTPCIIIENKVDLLLEYPKLENIWNISGIVVPDNEDLQKTLAIMPLSLVDNIHTFTLLSLLRKRLKF